MGFSRNKAVRALHFTGTSSVTATVNWIVEHTKGARSRSAVGSRVQSQEEDAAHEEERVRRRRRCGPSSRRRSSNAAETASWSKTGRAQADRAQWVCASGELLKVWRDARSCSACES